MRILKAGAALGFLAGCVTAPKLPADRVMLAYAGKAGDVCLYSAEQTLRGRISMQGMPQLLAVKTQAHIRQSVEEILEGGRRRVTMEYEMISLDVNGAQLEIDERWQRFRTEFIRAKSGILEEEKAPQSSRDMLELIARGLGTFFPVFPERPVSVGERWTRAIQAQRDSGGMKTVISFAFSRVENIDGTNCAILELEGITQGSGLSVNGGPGKLDLEYSGVAYFDMDSGRLLRARQKGGIRLKSKAEGIAMDARLNFIARIKLITDP